MAIRLCPSSQLSWLLNTLFSIVQGLRACQIARDKPDRTFLACCPCFSHRSWLLYSSNDIYCLYKTPEQNAGQADIWQSGAGLAADKDGNIYLITGEGDFNLNTGGNEAGDSLLIYGLLKS